MSTAIELVEHYRKEKVRNSMWYLNPTAKAGSLIDRYGEMALAQACLLLEGSSDGFYWLYRSVVGILQDIECPELQGGAQ